MPQHLATGLPLWGALPFGGRRISLRVPPGPRPPCCVTPASHPLSRSLRSLPDSGCHDRRRIWKATRTSPTVPAVASTGTRCGAVADVLGHGTHPLPSAERPVSRHGRGHRGDDRPWGRPPVLLGRGTVDMPRAPGNAEFAAGISKCSGEGGVRREQGTCLRGRLWVGDSTCKGPGAGRAREWEGRRRNPRRHACQCKVTPLPALADD